ncbi:hypothetical protein K1W69_16995 [Hoeflea sp. WL0058]|uniref:Uncharacterized protein n=1 Tax=Flavimaribacter sediminis TaxID=2865987 RepID=A0AAE2ZQA1_9HYPH|nr:hypothetical protein [Flavimaribacter sediminis]MBW8638896.1 hypothetical protein [Flavimaribacter sediminis]
MYVTRENETMTGRRNAPESKARRKPGARLRATAFVMPDFHRNAVSTPGQSPRPGEAGGSFRPAESLYADRNERSWATVLLAFLILLTIIGTMLWLLR